MTIEFLLLTCCLDETRFNVAKDVIDNFSSQFDGDVANLTLFDNASTHGNIIDVFKDKFHGVDVYQCDKNMGYWTAVDWWLNTHIPQKKVEPHFTYIIESDMIHYDFKSIWNAAELLMRHQVLGAVRLHEYSVKNFHLYNKDKPIEGSKRNIWQSHHNKSTGEPIWFVQIDQGNFYKTNFLTQLPALNRYRTISSCFKLLKTAESFTEFDFQFLYSKLYKSNAILDGGIFHCDPGSQDAKAITSSWTPKETLKKLGYMETRKGKIHSTNRYNVTVL